MLGPLCPLSVTMHLPNCNNARLKVGRGHDQIVPSHSLASNNNQDELVLRED